MKIEGSGSGSGSGDDKDLWINRNYDYISRARHRYDRKPLRRKPIYLWKESVSGSGSGDGCFLIPTNGCNVSFKPRV
jgi:hypothetical protein